MYIYNNNNNDNDNNSCIHNAHISIQRGCSRRNTLLLPRSLDFKTALTVHNFHSQGSIPCRAAYWGVQANAYTTYPSHPTGYPFIHLGGEQQCGKSVLLKDKSARHWRESNPQPFDPESRVHSNILKLSCDKEVWLFYCPCSQMARKSCVRTLCSFLSQKCHNSDNTDNASCYKYYLTFAVNKYSRSFPLSQKY